MLIWVTGTRTGKKLTKCHIFFKSKKLLRIGKRKNWRNLKSFYLILAGKFVPNKISGFRHNLECAPNAQSWLFFFKMFKIQLFCSFITQLVKKLQQCSLCEMIEDILPFILNTKRPLSDIWLLSYKQNSFGCVLKKIWSSKFFLRHPKLFCLYLSR